MGTRSSSSSRAVSACSPITTPFPRLRTALRSAVTMHACSASAAFSGRPCSTANAVSACACSCISHLSTSPNDSTPLVLHAGSGVERRVGSLASIACAICEGMLPLPSRDMHASSCRRSHAVSSLVKSPSLTASFPPACRKQDSGRPRNLVECRPRTLCSTDHRSPTRGHARMSAPQSQRGRPVRRRCWLAQERRISDMGA